jgi:uncharacterized protein YjaG (DUF416 family)
MNSNMINKLKSNINSLDYHQALTFGYLICKKLFPDYATFSEYEDFGKPDILYGGLVALRKQISGFDNINKINSLIDSLWNDEELTPDTDDFPGNISASLALNSVSAMYHCLKFASTKNKEFIIKVSDLSLESVIMFYVVSNNIDQNQPKEKYEEILNNAVFIQSEIHLQESLIEKIKTLEDSNKRIYTKLKTNDNKLVENSLFSQFIYT